MADCLIAFGSNQGDSQQIFAEAKERLSEFAAFGDVIASQPLITKAIGSSPQGQPDYLNAAFRLTTDLEPQQLLSAMLDIEQQLGRERHERWGARKIDLDLLLYDDLVLKSEDMTVPHPRMSFRRFVLEPASEIAADMIHPRCENIENQENSSKEVLMTIGDLLERINLESSELVWFTSNYERAELFTKKLQPDFEDWSFLVIDEDDWAFDFVVRPKTPKLVIIDSFERQVVSGPLLDLCDSPKTMFETEIRAALEAIKTNTVQ